MIDQVETKPPFRKAKASAILSATIFLVLVFLILILFNPVTYTGGQSDDGRYVETAWAWIANGPQIGRTHWALRWPVYIDAIASLWLWGPDRALLMLFPLLGWLLTVVLLTVAVYRRYGAIAAWSTAFAFITAPQFLMAGVKIGADLRELLFWVASIVAFLSACAPSARHPRLQLALSGALAAFAFATRETSASLILIYGVVFLTGRVIPRPMFLWLGLGFAAPLLTEYAILFHATGDPLWRLHVDMNHVNVPSGMLQGMVAHSANPVGGWTIAARWLYPGPINLWWPINPFLNLFARGDYGFVCGVTAGLLLNARYRQFGTSAEWRAVRWLILAALIQMAFNIFVLVTDPQPRMFLPALTIVCVIFGMAVQWHVENGRAWFLLPLIPFMILGGLRGLDEADNFTGLEEAAGTLMNKTVGPLYTDHFSRSHLALLDASHAARIHVAKPPIGGLAITVERPRWPDDTMNANLFALSADQCWTIVASQRAGRVRNIWMVDNVFLGSADPERSRPSLRVSIYRREQGQACNQAKRTNRLRRISTDY